METNFFLCEVGIKFLKQV